MPLTWYWRAWWHHEIHIIMPEQGLAVRRWQALELLVSRIEAIKHLDYAWEISCGDGFNPWHDTTILASTGHWRMLFRPIFSTSVDTTHEASHDLNIYVVEIAFRGYRKSNNRLSEARAWLGFHLVSTILHIATSVRCSIRQWRSLSSPDNHSDALMSRPFISIKRNKSKDCSIAHLMAALILYFSSFKLMAQ